jgi:hypothetical protein
MNKRINNFWMLFDELKGHTNLTDDKIIFIVNTLKGSYILDIEKQDSLNEEDCEIIDYLSENVATASADDISVLVFLMSSRMREKTHGASILSKIFIHKDLYNQISDQVGIKNAQLKINGVYINVYPGVIEANKFIGIGKSKFDSMSYENLLILGYLK